MSPPPPKKNNGVGDFFLEKAFRGETNFFGQIYGGRGGFLYMGSNDQIMQGGGKVSRMHFPVI